MRLVFWKSIKYWSIFKVQDALKHVQASNSGLKHEEISLNCSQFILKNIIFGRFGEIDFFHLWQHALLLIFFEFAQNQDAELESEI